MESITYETMELQWAQRHSSFDSFANIFMTYIETTTLRKTVFRILWINSSETTFEENNSN